MNIRIVSSTVGTDHYFDVVVEPNGRTACHGVPLLLGYYAENYFVCLDIESNGNGIAVIFKCLFCDLFHLASSVMQGLHYNDHNYARTYSVQSGNTVLVVPFSFSPLSCRRQCQQEHLLPDSCSEDVERNPSGSQLYTST